MATRIRRGKMVEIPAKWVGVFPTKKTLRQRPSKLTGKVKRVVKDVVRNTSYKDARDTPIVDE